MIKWKKKLNKTESSLTVEVPEAPDPEGFQNGSSDDLEVKISLCSPEAIKIRATQHSLRPHLYCDELSFHIS